MTPAEELLAAVKEHATARDEFAFHGTYIYVHRIEGLRVYVSRYDGQWCERINGELIPSASHPTASSAVQSAFARARGKQP